MYRQSPSRNQRSKGFKLKHGLQICVLVAVCFWLIYQVKHSHDKKREFDRNDAKISQINNEVVNLGRKDIKPQVKEMGTEIEKHEKEIEETEGEEEEKREEEELEEDNKTEEKEDEVNEKSDSEIDREEEFIEEEKEREEGDEKENEDKEIEEKDIDEKENEEKDIDEKENEEKDGQTENDIPLEDHEHEGGTRNTHEAREEQYKADDASSAVTHDGQTVSTENESGTIENQVNTVQLENIGNDTEEINIGQSQNATDFKAHELETAENGTSTTNVEKVSELFNSTITLESNDQQESSNNSTNVKAEIQGLSVENGTEIIISDKSNAQNATEGSNFQTISRELVGNSTEALENSQLGSNLTISNATENVDVNNLDSSNSTTNSQFLESENSGHTNISAETKEGFESTTLEVNSNEDQKKKSNTNGGMDTENGDEGQHDPIDSSDSSEDKETHIDLDTLPDIRTEGSNVEEVAEE